MNIEYMSSEDDTDLAALIIKIGYRKRSKYFDIPNYLNKIYDNWGYQTHNDVISILELDQMEYPRRAPSYEYYWNNDVVYNDPELPDDYKQLVHKVCCLRIVGGAENYDEMVSHLRTIIEKYGLDAYADAIRILGFEEDCWL